MSGIQPVALYAMRVPPGDFVLPATPGHAAMIRVTMASIDPTAEPDNQDVNSTAPMRSTLKVIRGPMGDDDYEDLLDSEDYSDEDDEDDDDDLDLDEAEVNGGPSDLKKSKKSKKSKIASRDADEDEDMDNLEGEDDDDEEEDSEDEVEVEKQLARILAKVNKGKGKAKALGDDDDDESDEDHDLDIDDMADEDDEPIVVCTLDTTHHYQQTLDLVVGANEEVYFMVTGTHAVHLTGNYVLPEDDGRAALYDDDDDDDEEDDYDLSPAEDELDGLDALIDGDDSESDALDDLPNPRITELGPEEDMPKVAKKKDAPKTNGVKPSAKRPAEDSDEDEDLDNMIARAAEKAAPTVNAEPAKKLSKAEKKKLKKLKNNDGNAVDAPSTDGTVDPTKETKAEKSTPNGEKKVQFAKKLEQGPTGSKATPAAADTSSDKKAFPTKTIQGVTISDRKPGAGPTASTKSKSRIEMRYIGKLANGQVFDSNKKGPPFAVTLGKGDVIEGFGVGLEGIQAGGERRLTIPPKMGYGNKKMPGIPAGSELVFDVKCLSVS